MRSLYGLFIRETRKEIKDMWMVYNREDSWECGYSVGNETEAREICKANEEFNYCYVGMETLAYCF